MHELDLVDLKMLTWLWLGYASPKCRDAIPSGHIAFATRPMIQKKKIFFFEAEECDSPFVDDPRWFLKRNIENKQIQVRPIDCARNRRGGFGEADVAVFIIRVAHSVQNKTKN